jgi:nitroreductase
MSADTHIAADGTQSLRGPGSSLWQDGRPTPAELDVTDWLLKTTRSNRKTLDLERPVDLADIETCLRIAMQAPTAHNDQRWHWIVVTDPAKRARIGEVYAQVWEQMSKGERAKVRRFKGADQQYTKIQDSANWLPEHLGEVPVHVIPCMVGPRYDNEFLRSEWKRWMTRRREAVRLLDPSRDWDPSLLWLDGGYFASIYPAVWSFQLALRARGLGSTLTVVHLAAEQEVSKVLGLPDTVLQTCLLPVAHVTKTDFRPAKRAELGTRISWNSWLGTR